ncbi:TrmH family RNA methyltransferase [Kordiimonas marina]|uniref:TrmH family RNA methyltransferase n=1 Tax=Kordiimonas marina TaxID=2872312 RepID=UPI001FF633C2|nr:RNA methyltransferase [Kordiimonas marina]MCJ9428415.1 RNA methyltransferase [Kordiimonas marina]
MAHMDRFGPLVTSQQNARVKAARSLAQKKFRQKDRTFLAEGEAFLRMGLKAGFELREVFVIDDSLSRIDDLLHAGHVRARDVALTTPAVQASLAGRDNPQAVISVFRQKALTLDEVELKENALWVALQEPRDPGNLGTVIRTADAAGADGVILLGGGCDPYGPEVVRASMGSLFAVPVIRADLKAFRDWQTMAATPGQTVGLALEGSTIYTDAEYSAPLILMAGNEQTGLPEAYRAACDRLIHIPMAGEAESLNLAVSTAIVLYHAAHALHRFQGERATPSTLDFKPQG